MYKLYFLLLLLFASVNGFTQKLAVNELQCEHKSNPLAINSANPAFSWQLQSSKRGVMQTGYRILVSDKVSLLKKGIGNIWDSKKSNSDNSTLVLFAGEKLKAATEYFWKVQVWDNSNTMKESKAAKFRTALFETADWSNAQWIGYAEMPDSLRTVPGVNNTDTKRKLGSTKLKERVVVPLFRKEFSANENIASAIIYISGLGQYELSMNGKKVGNSFLAPGWTHYDKRVLYNAYNITSVIKKGSNAIGVIVGNGFYNVNRERYIKLAIAYGYPKMICKILVTYADGTSTIVVSDQSWKTAPSPITFSSIFGGEDYDANLERSGWNNIHFNGKGWKSALVVAAPKGNMEAEMDNPVKVMDELNVQSVKKPKDSVYVFDFAQNLSGIVEIKVQGKKGQTVKLWPAELLHSDDLINQNATGKPYYFSYTLKGGGIETWRPKFTYYGFRYVQVEGAVPDTSNTAGDFAKIISIKSLHTSNSSPENGNFECSNPLFNKINELIKWAIKSNLQSVATDCPHREKLSWLEQDYLVGGSINANYNLYLLYKKLINDMMDAQTEDGLVPDIAPQYDYFEDNGYGFNDSPEWGSASVIVPWLIYKWYGDAAIMEAAYPMMKKYLAYLKSKSKNNILDYGLGDWFDYGPNRPGVAQLTPKTLTATAIYYYDVKLLSAIAARLNKAGDALYFEKEAAAIYRSFNDSFYNVQTKVYATGSQTAMAMPLVVGLVSANDKDAVMKNMVDSIIASGKKLTAGDIGFHFLIQALHNGGASQLIYDMNYRDDVPGYGYQIKKGATALTESWPALEEVSNNHLMLGHIMQWFYEGLGGINQSDDSYGYKHIIIKPEIVGDINFVKTNHQTVYGNIVSDWEKTGNSFNLSVEIPANTTANVYLPAGKENKIMESNKILEGRADIKLIGFENGRAVIEIGSGKYKFTVKY